ncbi:MAG: hypothetical protein ACRDT2_18575 [Natronosporangium sp.]
MSSQGSPAASFQVTGGTAEKVRLLATAWRTTEEQVILRLLDAFLAQGQTRPPAELSDRIDIHAVYTGIRVEAEFEMSTARVLVTSGVLAGRTFRSPSGAAIAVVQSLNPSVSPNRNGWNFWIITDTGEFLGTLRRP